MSWYARCIGAVLLLVSLPVLARGLHVDLVDYPAPEANWERAYGLEAALVREFDRLCGEPGARGSTATTG